MTENEKDAQTETNMDHNTSKEADPETFSENLTVGGTEMERKLSLVDRLDNRK